MQTAIIRFFNSISSPFLDILGEAFSYLGEETVFILIIAWMLWCGSKKQGYIICSTLFTSLTVMNIIKAIVRAPRPFQVLPEITGKRLATATGYSFPSGHTTGAASFYSSLAVTARKQWLSLVCATAIVAVGLSRTYLGVHWPLDVFAGLVLGITMTITTSHMFGRLYDNPRHLIRTSWIAGSVGTLAALVLALLIQSDSIDPVAFTDLMKILSLAGCGYLGFALDQQKIHYLTTGSLWVRILRFVIGVVLVLLVMASKSILPTHMVFSFFRYALVGLLVTVLYPWLGRHIRIAKGEYLFTPQVK